MIGDFEGITGLSPWNIDQLPVEEIAIADLRGADSPRITGENQAHIHELAEIQDQLPPILVHRRTMRVTGTRQSPSNGA